MNYRHAYHAGNFADVLKHALLCWIVRYLQQKAAPLSLIDTHAGAGFYDLTGVPAQKTAEAKDGILRLAARADVPLALAPFLDLVQAANGEGPITRYPGSPMLMAALARPVDRVVACELHPEDGVDLAAAAPRNVRVVVGDGYQTLPSLVPPPEKRGLVLIDPPFEDPGEFERLAEAFIAAHRKWPIGVYMLWFPIKDETEAARFRAELANAAIPKLTAVTLDVARPEGLSATGLVLCNAPFTLAEQWATASAWLAHALAQGEGAASDIRVLSRD
jgi:23S rRNA (adenine2030-N6)-methyltransferase